jgi:hypothetical protein
MFLDDAGKMNLLKYSRGDYQENLGVLKRISRNPARKSTTTIRVQLQGWLALHERRWCLCKRLARYLWDVVLSGLGR